jgi:hypothetical protein
VSPIGNQRQIRRFAADVAAEGHRTERAAVIALPARENAKARGLADFKKILADKFDRGFGGFRTAAGEIDPAPILEIARSKGEDAGSKFFGGFGVELGGVGKGDAIGLLGHGLADFGDAVADADDGGLAGGVEESAAIGGDDPGTFAAHGDRVILAKIAGKERGGGDSGGHWKIVAEGMHGDVRSSSRESRGDCANLACTGPSRVNRNACATYAARGILVRALEE